MSATSRSFVPRYTMGEEVAHTISHGVGLFLALIANVFLIAEAAQSQTPFAVTAVGVYGLTMCFMFASSTLYHGSFGSRFQGFFNLLDHIAIFLKIAGGYTPFALLVLPRETGVPLLAFVWSLAAVGAAFKIFAYSKNLGRRFKFISLAIYLGMGWSGVLLVGDLYELLPFWGFMWLAFGGAAYTIGAVIYAMKSIPMGHFIWHLFVLAGSTCHAVSVYMFVI